MVLKRLGGIMNINYQVIPCKEKANCNHTLPLPVVRRLQAGLSLTPVAALTPRLHDLTCGLKLPPVFPGSPRLPNLSASS